MPSWTNRRFDVDGMHFDAAIDYCHELHTYTAGMIPEGTIPVELYNCDDSSWDIYMIYPAQPTDEAILAGIREWIDSNPTDLDEYYLSFDQECNQEYNQDDYIHQEGGYTPKELYDTISAMMEFSCKGDYDKLNKKIAELFGYDSDAYRHFDTVYRQLYGDTMMDGPYTA